MLFQHLQDYYERRDIWSALHDPLTASVALGTDFVRLTEIDADFDGDGRYKIGGDTRVIVSENEISKAEKFMQIMTERI